MKYRCSRCERFRAPSCFTWVRRRSGNVYPMSRCRDCRCAVERERDARKRKRRLVSCARCAATVPAWIMGRYRNCASCRAYYRNFKARPESEERLDAELHEGGRCGTCRQVRDFTTNGEGGTVERCGCGTRILTRRVA